jgi:hypothetical protein
MCMSQQEHIVFVTNTFHSLQFLLLICKHLFIIDDVCHCVCARVCVRACVRVCVQIVWHECVYYTHHEDSNLK